MNYSLRLYSAAGGWRKVSSYPSIIKIIKSRKIRWAGHVARMGEKMNEYRILVGKPEGKKPLERLRRRRLGDIEMDLRGIE
jgi:hypothetical protein